MHASVRTGVTRDSAGGAGRAGHSPGERRKGMRFSDILGHERPLGILRRALRAGRIAHAYLFHGPGGVGKRTVAQAFAAALLCEAPEGEEACGRCEACAKAKGGTHPDLHLLEVPESKSRIPIEQFHTLEADLQLAAYAGRRRVAIVEPADRLSREAQHAFLKTLEEPRPDTVFILVTSRPSALIATILSRCQRIGFGSIPADALVRALVEGLGCDPERARLLAAIARGSLGRATALGQAEALEERNEFLDVAGAAAAGILAPALAWAEGFRWTEQDRQRALELLDLLRLEARDILVLASGGRPSDLAHRDRAERIAREARRPGSADRAGRAYARISEAQRDIQRNVNPALALQGMFSDLAPGAGGRGAMDPGTGTSGARRP